MATELGVGYISIVPETSKIAPGIKKAFSGAGNVGSQAGSRMSSALGGALKTGAAAAGAAAAGVIGTSLVKGFNRLSAIDQAKAKFEGLGNSAQQVEGIMGDVTASVKGTAFGTADAANVAAMAMASGAKPGEELQRVLRLVGDSAAFAGKGFGDLGPVFTEAMSMGKVTGETLAQMRDNSIPAIQALSKELGVSTAEVQDMASKGQISFEDFASAMEHYIGGQALKSGDTFKGALDNLGAAMGRFGESMLAPAFAAAPSMFGSLGKVFDSMSESVKPAATQIGETLAPAFEQVGNVIETKLAPAAGTAAEHVGDLMVKFADKAVEPEMWERIGGAMDSLGNAGEKAWPAVSQLADSMLSIAQNISIASWKALGDTINALTPVVESVLVPLAGKVADFSEKNPGKVQALATAFLGFKALGTVAKPISAFAKAAGNANKAAKGLKGVATVGRRAFEIGGLKAGFGAAGTVAKTAFPTVGKAAGNVSKLGKAASGAGKYLKPLVGLVSRFAGWLGPVGLAVSLVTAGLTLFFTKTETGRELWSKFMDVLKGAGEWLQDTFSNLWSALSEKVSGAFQSIKDTGTHMWDSVKGAFEAGVAWIGEQWSKVTEFFSPLTEAIGAAFQTGWEIVKDYFATGWLAVKAFFTGQWGEIPGIIGAGWETIKGHFGAGVAAAGEKLGEFWDNVSGVFGRVKDWAVGKAQEMWDTVSTSFMNGVNAAVDWVAALPGRVWGFITDMASRAWATVQEMWANVSTAFQTGVDNAVAWVRGLPDQVRGFFAGAGEWLVQSGRDILNGLWNGLKEIWDRVSSWISEKKEAIRNFGSRVDSAASSRISVSSRAAGGVAGFATGGRLPVTGPGTNRTDGILGVDGYGMPTARVDAGEWVINRKSSDKYHGLLAAINADRLPRGLDLGGFGLQALADGGQVSPEQMLAFAKGEAVNGQRAPRSLEGATYVWGGGLLANWGDCSGVQSAFASLAAGEPVAGRKFATMSQGAWATAHGFRSGLGTGPRYAMGYFNGGPYGGHTGGTIFFGDGSRVNVEMGGSRGNGQIGGQAAGADHSSFPNHYWYPLLGGGSITSTSADGVTIEDGGTSKEVGWGSANGLFELAKKGLLNIYDQGGLLRHGQLAMNLSGRAEQVMTAMQWDKLVAGLTDLADAVRKGNLSYQWIEDRFGSRAGGLVMEATGGALGGWLADTKLLQDAEKGLAEVRRKATSESEAVKKAEENLKKVKDKNAIDLQVAREKNGNDEKKMKAAQQRATDAVRKAELQLEQARQQATSSTGKYADELKAAEQAVEAARQASTSRGFNNGANLQAFAAGGSLADYLNVVEAVGGFGEKIGDMGQGFKLATGAASALLTSAGSMRKAYEEQAEANAALAGAEADLKAARESGDQAAVAEAETALGKARQTAAKVAVAAGHAEISAAIGVAGAVIDVIKGIWDWALKLRKRMWDAYINSFEAQGKAYEQIGQWQEALADQQRTLTNLMVAHQLAIIEATEAQRQLRVANWGVRIAEVAGIRQVATAAEKLWDFEKSQRILQKAGYQDLSLAYDRFRWNAMQAGEEATGAVEQTRQWRSLAFDVFKASAEADKKRLEAQKGQVQAFQNAAETTLKMQRAQEDIQRQQELITRMTQQAGMSLQAATIGQEIARVNKQVAEMEEWYSRVGNRVRTLGTSAVNLGIDNKWGQANKAYWKRHDELTQYLTKLTGKTGAPTGMAELEAWRKLNQDLARSNSDAAKYIASPGTASEIALSSFKLDKSLFDQQTVEIENLRKLEDLELVKRFTEALAPITEKISGYGQLAEAFGAFAEAERTDSQKLRDALLGEGQVRLAAAEALRTTPVQVSNPYEVTLPSMPDPAPVTLIGNSFDGDAVEKLLVQLGHEVDRLKDNRPSPVAVMAAKRTMR
ncbi:MAG: tape measure protein [Corynebacterium glucuronolyticum]|nr:tape measure protein [Mycobacteriaceae bacterium]MDY5834613.1 tape measure protein [Corynebacterium glucuronolyticum]